MTYSIVARDPKTGAFGVATATGGPAVGALVPHAMAGTGAIATQSDTNPFYGTDGLQLLKDAMRAEDVLERLTGADGERQKRQCIVIGRDGAAAAWTGDAAENFAGHRVGDNFAVAGNMLAGEQVLAAMVSAFETGHGAALEDRLMAVLQAGEAAGGDRRGTKSAALKVYGDQVYPRADFRIDFSETPVADLGRLLERAQNGEYGKFLAERPTR